jgi:hypothetical protein
MKKVAVAVGCWEREVCGADTGAVRLPHNEKRGRISLLTLPAADSYVQRWECGTGRATSKRTINAMTQAASSGHVAGQPHFSDAEWASFQADDKKAATAVVGLMGAIFSVGLVLYFIVFLLVKWNY